MEDKEKRYISKGVAKEVVDILFDNELFKDHLTRSDMNSLEDLIDFQFNSTMKTHIKYSDFFKKLKEKGIN